MFLYVFYYVSFCLVFMPISVILQSFLKLLCYFVRKMTLIVSKEYAETLGYSHDNYGHD